MNAIQSRSDWAVRRTTTFHLTFFSGPNAAGETNTGKEREGEMKEREEMEKQFPVLSRRQIEALIADGRAVMVVDGYVLKVDAWIRYHPGGDKAIMHMVGRDATDEVNG